MSQYDPDDFLMGGGTASFKFTNVGDEVSGKVVRREVKQQTDFKTKKPLYFDDGQPRNQLIITLATDLRDPEDPSDNGHRNIYVRGRALGTLRDAVKDAGAKGVEVGGHLRWKFSDTEAPETPGLSPTKLFEGTYTSKANGALMGGGGQEAPAAVSAPAEAALAADDAAKAAALIASLTPAQRKALGVKE